MDRRQTGREDVNLRWLAEDIRDLIQSIVEARLLGAIDDNGRVYARAISGVIAPSSGGTGNATGQTAPLDGSVTNPKIPDGANIDPAKLDQGLLHTLVYEIMAEVLRAGTGVTLDLDAMAETITINAFATEAATPLYWSSTPLIWGGDGMVWG